MKLITVTECKTVFYKVAFNHAHLVRNHFKQYEIMLQTCKCNNNKCNQNINISNA